MNVVTGEVKVPAIFGDHMVLQRGQQNPVWGWAEPGETVTVTIGQQTHSSVADQSGKWRVVLQPLEVGAPLELTIGGKTSVTFEDVVVGEVWLCSGQSNMAWPVQSANDPDLEIRTADYPGIRLISIPQNGTQERQYDFEGEWQRCSPQTVAQFSAVGYFFGRRLHETIGVPIGLIDNAWGGSAAEAWVRRDLLESDARYGALMDRWEETERSYGHDEALAEYETAVEAWQKQAEEARKKGQEPPRRPRAPRNPLTGQHRPANLYNGVLQPIIGFGIRGVIWYQGESNASRAYQYRHLFPLMIENWRDEWGQGDFPFYYVQLADFRDEKPEPEESDWAELREAQTMTLKASPNVGQAVIIDLGESHDIHPKNKQVVASRLSRWALARDYGLDLAYRSPEYESMEVVDGKIVVTFDHVGAGLDTFDVEEPVGFVIAGDDRRFVWARARIIGENQVEVWHEAVTRPTAVRYAWADNPVCNLQSREGLPATPFRTDDWPGITVNTTN
jgi:sialate O-acetylesterase